MFISMALPYSVIKGETFPIQASIFNYAKTCLPIQVDLLADKRFKMPNEKEATAKYCICPDEKLTHEFKLEALKTEMENGLRVGVRVSSINETNICEENSIKKFFRFRDI